MRDALHHVLTIIAASGAHQHFGVCQDCAYLVEKRTATRRERASWALGCLLFGVPMEPHELVSSASIFTEERAPRGRTSRMSSPLRSAEGTLN